MDTEAEATAFESAVKERFPDTALSRVLEILTLDITGVPVYEDPVVEAAWVGWRLAKGLPL